MLEGERQFAGVPVLVTGGLGFIGSNVARRLADLGASVRVVDALLPNCGGLRANLRGYEDTIEVRIADLCDRAAIDAAVEGCRYVFAVAGRVSHLDSMKDPVADASANVIAQATLLEACRARAPDAVLVYASTRQIYGRPQALPVDETHPVDPVDVNGICKAAGEQLFSLYAAVHGLKTVSLRLTNTFGPRMRVKDARQTFLGLWLRAVLERQPFEVWGGAQLRDFTFVDDAVEAFLAAAVHPGCHGHVYNVGGAQPLPLLDLARLLSALADDAPFVVKSFPPERKAIDIGDYHADDRAFRAATGWRPTRSLEDGLRESLAYYRDRLADYV